jgi:hypothetical protein
MTKAYVLTAYTDAEGRHEVGDEVDIPQKTDAQKVGFENLVNYRIITTDRSEAEEAANALKAGETPQWARGS